MLGCGVPTMYDPTAIPTVPADTKKASKVSQGWSHLLGISRDSPYPHRPAYSGPERRSGISALASLLTAMLDEVDYGMLLLDDWGRLLHLNHGARVELSTTHPLCLQEGLLTAHDAHDASTLQDVLADARRRGLRRLVTFGEGVASVTVAVVPLPLVAAVGSKGRPDQENAAGAGHGILVMLGKRQLCESLSVEAYARMHRLTVAETAVLKALCMGQRPGEIAHSKGVAVSTVRTQIGKIRAKTGAESIAAALQQVAVLPPIVCALRGHGGSHWVES